METAILSIEYVQESLKRQFVHQQAIKITANHFIIGRAPGCDLAVDDPALSRQHVKLYAEDERYFLVDLDSTNGSFLNEVRVQPKTPYVLRSNALVRLGNALIFRFTDPHMTEVIVEPQPFLTGGVWLDTNKRIVYVERQLLDPPLTITQFNLLALLIAQSGQVVTRDRIADHLWRSAFGGITPQMIDNTASRLRARLKELDAAHTYIETVRGVGYKFSPRPGQLLPAIDRLHNQEERGSAGK